MARTHKTGYRRPGRPYANVFAAALVLLCCAYANTLYAHEDLHDQAQALGELISAQPDNAALYLRRAEIQRSYRHWPQALADYQKARELDPGRKDIDFFIARMWFDAGQQEQALRFIERFLTAQPGHHNGLLLKARVLAKQAKYQRAAQSYELAVSTARRPLPEHYLEWSEVLAGAGRRQQAIVVLKKGIAALGSLAVLLVRAAELEQERGDTGAALNYLDALPASLANSPQYLLKKADWLIAAGKKQDAAAALQAALDKIETLPLNRRSQRVMISLKQDIELRLKSLH